MIEDEAAYQPNYVQTETTSDPICNSAGCSQYLHSWVPPLGYDVDYHVPSFGPDPDMVGTMKSIEIGEVAHEHKLVMGTADSAAQWHNVAKDTLYNYDPELDEEMKYTADHLSQSQLNRGHKWVIEDEPVWTPNYIQLEEEPVTVWRSQAQTKSDFNDACNSDHCVQSAWYKAKLDEIVQYPTPHLDEDVTTTMGHEAAASTEVGHVWNV